MNKFLKDGVLSLVGLTDWLHSSGDLAELPATYYWSHAVVQQHDGDVSSNAMCLWWYDRGASPGYIHWRKLYEKGVQGQQNANDDTPILLHPQQVLPFGGARRSGQWLRPLRFAMSRHVACGLAIGARGPHQQGFYKPCKTAYCKTDTSSHHWKRSRDLFLQSLQYIFCHCFQKKVFPLNNYSKTVGNHLTSHIMSLSHYHMNTQPLLAFPHAKELSMAMIKTLYSRHYDIRTLFVSPADQGHAGIARDRVYVILALKGRVEEGLCIHQEKGADSAIWLLDFWLQWASKGGPSNSDHTWT